MVPWFAGFIAALGALTGIFLAWIWKRFSDRDRATAAKRQMQARLYAMRLDSGDPVLVLRAQRELAAWTGRYLAVMLRPALLTGAIAIFVSVLAHATLAHRSLAPGESTIVMARWSGDMPGNNAAFSLEGHGASIETPAVRLAADRALGWRVRMHDPDANVILRMPEGRVSRSMSCAAAFRLPALEHPDSPLLDVACPEATLDIGGFDLGYPAWFLSAGAAAMVAAILLRSS